MLGAPGAIFAGAWRSPVAPFSGWTGPDWENERTETEQKMRKERRTRTNSNSKITPRFLFIQAREIDLIIPAERRTPVTLPHAATRHTAHAHAEKEIVRAKILSIQDEREERERRAGPHA